MTPSNAFSGSKCFDVHAVTFAGFAAHRAQLLVKPGLLVGADVGIQASEVFSGIEARAGVDGQLRAAVLVFNNLVPQLP